MFGYTYLLTPLCRVLLEKLTGLQLVKKFPVFHRTRRFITALNKRPPYVSILGQPNPVHIPTSHLLEIRPNIIHPSTPSSPQWSPSVRFPHQGPIHSPLLTHTRHMPSPSHSSRLHYCTQTQHLDNTRSFNIIFYMFQSFIRPSSSAGYKYKLHCVLITSTTEICHKKY